MDELSRLASILDACEDKLEILSAQLQVGELLLDLRHHPDLAYLDAQFTAYYS